MLKKLLLTAILATLMLSSVAKAADKIIVATDCTFPPMEYLDDKKKPVGYDPALAVEIGKVLGIEVDVQNIAWDGIFAGVAAGKYDVVASGVSITPERAKAFGISEPYYDVYPTIITMVGAAMKEPADLKGKKVGGQIGNSSLGALQKLDTGCTIREYDDVGLAIEDMIAGRIDAVSMDYPVALYYLNKRADYANKLHIAMKFGEPEQYGLVVSKKNKDLLAKLNDAIKTLKENGTLAKLEAEYMGTSH